MIRLATLETRSINLAILKIRSINSRTTSKPSPAKWKITSAPGTTELERDEVRGLLVGSVSAAGSRGEFALELLDEFFACLGDGFGPEVRFPMIMERGLWRECHGGAGTSAEDDWRLFGFPAVGAAVRALVGGLVEVLGLLADFDDGD